MAILCALFLVAIPKGNADNVPVVVEKPKTIQEQITDVLPKVFLKICKAESECNPRAMNWNCYYPDPTPADPKHMKSRACDKPDRLRAWSVDCGLFQINAKGTECPLILFDIKVNISKTVALYDARGLDPWQASLAVWTSKSSVI